MKAIIKNIKFDLIDQNEDTNQYYSAICHDCMVTHPSLKHTQQVSNENDVRGTCGVEGCKNDATYYIDFNTEDVSNVSLNISPYYIKRLEETLDGLDVLLQMGHEATCLHDSIVILKNVQRYLVANKIATKEDVYGETLKVMFYVVFGDRHEKKEYFSPTESTNFSLAVLATASDYGFVVLSENKNGDLTEIEKCQTYAQAIEVRDNNNKR